MQKLLILLAMTLPSALLNAGGNIPSTLSSVADIGTKSCKTDRVYIEEDAQLMWEDQLYTDSEDGAYKQNYSVAKAGNFRHAEAYCRTLDYMGFSDWRLPTSDELQHVHRKYGQVFTYFRGTDFWTSTPASKGRYYVVYPADAYVYEQEIARTNYIRCVRCLHDGDTTTGPAIVE